MTRKICVWNGKRGGFGALTPTMDAINAHPELEMQLVVTDQHLYDRFGHTVDEVEERFPVAATIEMEQAGDSNEDRARAIGRCLERSVDVLAGLRPDVIVIAAYGKLLPPPVLTTPLRGCLNLHPSLLPRYRGPSPVSTAILDGEEATGVTLLMLDEEMDTGPIISQREYPLSGREIAEPLTAALFRLGADLLLECLAPWVAGRLTARPQDDARATITRKLERGDGDAEWRATGGGWHAVWRTSALRAEKRPTQKEG